MSVTSTNLHKINNFIIYNYTTASKLIITIGLKITLIQIDLEQKL